VTLAVVLAPLVVVVLLDLLLVLDVEAVVVVVPVELADTDEVADEAADEELA
jgi:hypothetical protein